MDSRKLIRNMAREVAEPRRFGKSRLALIGGLTIAAASGACVSPPGSGLDQTLDRGFDTSGSGGDGGGEGGGSSH